MYPGQPLAKARKPVGEIDERRVRLEYLASWADVNRRKLPKTAPSYYKSGAKL